MKLYLVRHGQTEGNPRHLYQSRAGDDLLSETGKKQAEILCERFKKIPLDVILTSPLSRAEETTKIINGNRDLPIERTDLLTEKRWPKELEGKSTYDPTIADLKKLLLEKELTDPTWHHSDEESFADIRARAQTFLDHIAPLTSTQKHVLVVSHAHFLKLLMGVMIYGPEVPANVFRPFFHRVSMHNTGITVCEYGPTKTAGNAWHLLTINDHAHLGDYHRQPH